MMCIRRIIAILILAGGMLSARAQTDTALEAVRLKCRYVETMMIDTLSGNTNRDTLTLLIGSRWSSFYSRNHLIEDSVMTSPGGVSKWMSTSWKYAKEGRFDLFTSTTSDYLYRDKESGIFLTRTGTIRERVEWTEPCETLEWIYRDSVKTVLGYECHLAEADFRGRHWTAWYTLEVPISEGPWKLWGLPGLICEASADGGQYQYSLVAVLPDPGETIRLYSWSKKYRQTNRIDYYRARRRDSALTNEKAEQKGMGELVSKSKYDFRERDYR